MFVGLQVVTGETGSDDESYSDEESPKKRRDLLTRRPSYRKILNDLGGGEIAGMFFIAWQVWHRGFSFNFLFFELINLYLFGFYRISSKAAPPLVSFLFNFRSCKFLVLKT